MPTVRAVDAVAAPGARCEVVIVDGVRRRRILTLSDIAAPPRRVLLPRPADVPALEALRGEDADWVIFERADGEDDDDEGVIRPVYHQVTRATAQSDGPHF